LTSWSLRRHSGAQGSDTPGCLRFAFPAATPDELRVRAVLPLDAKGGGTVSRPRAFLGASGRSSTLNSYGGPEIDVPSIEAARLCDKAPPGGLRVSLVAAVARGPQQGSYTMPTSEMRSPRPPRNAPEGNTPPPSPSICPKVDQVTLARERWVRGMWARIDAERIVYREALGHPRRRHARDAQRLCEVEFQRPSVLTRRATTVSDRFVAPPLLGRDESRDAGLAALACRTDEAFVDALLNVGRIESGKGEGAHISSSEGRGDRSAVR
jgi:hypothetical protein